MSNPLKVIVAGAGVGGLTLAQGLKKAGVEVAVYERDAEPTSRIAGYRLSISPSGAEALRACLPMELYQRFTGESGRPVRRVTFLDHHFKTLLAIPVPEVDRASPSAERPIARRALRCLLLAGLEDIVHFGKRLVACEERGNEAVAHFADGSSVSGDLIVGADGANSPTRACLLPGVGRDDLGIVAFGGKVPLNATSRPGIPEAILMGPTMVIGPRGGFMFASALEYEDIAGRPDREEYAMWGVSAPRARLGLPADLTSLDARALRAAARSVVAGWDPRLHALVDAADLASLTTFPIRAAAPAKPWQTRRITLLGDALHNMPPYRGVGANVALWDAALLTDTLARVSAGKAPLLAALADYERRMRDNGFAAVRRSVAAARQFHADSPVRYAFVKTMFRGLGFVAPLREAVLGGR